METAKRNRKPILDSKCIYQKAERIVINMSKKQKAGVWTDSFPSIQKNAPFYFVETYNSLRTNILFSCVSKHYRKIVITSSIPGEGKSTVAINLAISLTNAGYRVLLVDCDLRKPSLHRYLQTGSKTQGLTTALLEIAEIGQCLFRLKDIGIDFIPSGPIPPHPAELLGSAKMASIIDTLSKRYDYILFDTPPVSVVTDAAVLSKLADGVVLVIRHHFTTVDAAQTAKSNLDHVGADVIGTVINQFKAKKSGIAYKSYHKYEYDYQKA